MTRPLRYSCFTLYFLLQFTAIYDPVIAEDRGLQFAMISQADAAQAAFYVLYALHFLCLASAKLMVLDGLTLYAHQRVLIAKGMDKRFKLLRVAATAVAIAACVCNMVGLVANSVAAYFFSRGADFEAKASGQYARGDTDANQTVAQASRLFTLGNAANSVQNYTEALVLVVIVVVYFAAVLAVMRILNIGSRIADNIIKLASKQGQQRIREVAASGAAAGGRMRFRITLAARVCCASFFFRASWSILVAVSQSGYDYSPLCGDYPSGQCMSCQPVGVAIRFTLFFTPEAQMLVELLSSPLPLSFALWGMTSDRDRQELYSDANAT